MMKAREIYNGSSGEATTALYKRLEAIGPIGVIAMNLFRACKASERAKKYRRRYKGEAYEKKNWSLGLLCDALQKDGASAGVRFGWKQDDSPPVGYPWVLYVDLPTGQASFHSATRGAGPDYPSEWDNRNTSSNRIIAWVQILLGEISFVRNERHATLAEYIDERDSISRLCQSPEGQARIAQVRKDATQDLL